jgi:hypothetical protein
MQAINDEAPFAYAHSNLDIPDMEMLVMVGGGGEVCVVD